ncbi:MAG: protein kinase [candidate division Zixibacteria bacterium]|nr:protein kinase [candidate division Zixibacteria bacterium]NIR65979.1 protein kinase [candidate division Zixibacteria bacterium]NIS16864.1 protein kinase [candidate division Zixibacteria bacterium]NIS47623.1 protein kinase [candidate division Zixibacteria bacterium]NIT53274.1 protein kinase [candidate division Zixibacteria bacterium]
MAANGSDDDKTKSFTALTAGVVVSHYKIISKIGAGGMGEVYLAEDTKLKRQVALKFLPPPLCQDEDCCKRFKREAQAAAKLDHPNIVPVYEVGEFKERPFFAMAHIQGKSLREVIKAGKLTIPDAISYTMQICEGLHKAHESGVVHRDIKPSNVIIDSENRPRIVDFGLATVSGEEKLTKTGSTLGTMGYMSPEQIEGKQVDHRSDLFSVGVIFYKMITGRMPFEAEHEAAIQYNIVHEAPEPMARYKSGVTGELQQIIDKALSKDPSVRYQHADGILTDLKRLQIETTTTKQSRPGVWVAGAVVLVALIALLLWRPWLGDPVTDTVPMIAVLPFDNLGLPEDEYFADGMTEEITSRLARVKGLGVISRTSAIKYKNSDKQLREIGKELGVAYILEGTVRWSKEEEHSRVRITPQLIRVSDDRHLWANNYERELMDIFEVQADIAIRIVENLGVELLEKDSLTLSTRPTENAEAYKFYLRGADLLKRMEFRQHLLMEAINMFDSAVNLDPGFARAYVYRSMAHTVCYINMFGNIFKHADQALQAAEKALALEPDLAYAHLALGHYYNFIRRDYTRAMEEFLKARPEHPNDPYLFMGIGLVQMRRGEFDEAIGNFQRAAELDPLNPTRYQLLTWFLPFIYQYEQAEQSIDQAIWLDRTRPDFYADKIFLYASWYGDLEKMRQVVDDAKEYVNPMAIAFAQKWNFGIFDVLDDSLLLRFAKASVGKVAPHGLYSGLANIYHRKERHDVAAAYADSARIILEMLIEKVPYDANLHVRLSFAFAHLGQYDAAINEARRAKELESVDDCHW